MATAFWSLLNVDGAWTLGHVTADGVLTHRLENCESCDDVALQVAEHMASVRCHGSGLLLGLGSDCCLPAQFAVKKGSGKVTCESLAFRMEEFVPLSSEDFVADFVVRSDDCFGVAVESAPIGRIVTSLEEQGVFVDSIVPTTLLVAEGVVEAIAGAGALLIVVRVGSAIELIRVEDKQVTRWERLADDPVEFERCVKMLALSAPVESAVCCDSVNDDASRVLDAAAPGGVLREDVDFLETAVRRADAVLARRRTACIELRRGSLAAADPYRPLRPLLHMTGVVVAVCLIVVSVMLLHRANRYDGETAGVIDSQEAVFEGLFPGNRIPIGIRSRLESELTRLKGVSGQPAEFQFGASTLPVLCRFMESLPKTMRYRVFELRFQGNRLYFEGEVRSHGDADVLASSLRRSGFDVEPPETEQLANRNVSIRINAEMVERQSESPADT